MFQTDKTRTEAPTPYASVMRNVWTQFVRIEAGRAKREAINKELTKHKVKLKITKREKYIEGAHKEITLFCHEQRIYQYSEHENVRRRQLYNQTYRIEIQADTIQYAKDLWIDHSKMLINEHCSAIVRWDQ